MNRNCLFSYLIIIVFFFSCSGNKKNSNINTDTNKVNNLNKRLAETEDSIKLTDLVRSLYKWHITDTPCVCGFKPAKRNPSDTLYTSIDLDEAKKRISTLKETGFFTDDFLDNYLKIGVRMDKELREGTSLWPEGELSTFGDDADEWCNCQDSPVDDYWKIIKLTNINYGQNEANFKWTWGDKFYYNVKAKKEKGNWKISYLQGFDMNAYNWKWWKKNKK